MEEQLEHPGGVPPILVQGLTRRYGDQVAVRDLAITLAPGEILGLVGPNGAGKTTTLRSISGVLPLQEGRIVIAGHDLETDPALAKKGLAWVPDEPHPFDALTVWEHLEFTASVYGVEGWEAKGAALLEQFELDQKRDALGSELSRGMRQKLAFCCAWLSEPRLLLLDEPLSGLDPRGIRAARQAIRDLANTGVGVILSSHLLELIEALADRLLILHEGSAIFTGTLQEAHANLAPETKGGLEEIFLHVTENGETT